MALTLNGTTGLSGIVGSAGTPALQGTDTNTGYFFGTDILGLSTGGSERLRVDSNGNVSLGNITAAPTSTAYNSGTLHLHQATGGASGGSQLKMTTSQSGAAAGDGAYLAYYGNNELYIYNKENADISFGTNALERLRIKSNGQIGINMAPSADAQFCIKNSDDSNYNVLDCYNDNGNKLGGFSQDSTGNGSMGVRTNAGVLNTFFRSSGISYLNGGNVGIGRTDPGHKLAILGGSNSQLEIKGTEADFWLTSTGGGSDKAWRILGSTGGSTHRFRIYDNANGREPFYIDNDGVSHFGGDVKVLTGDIQMGSGRGINFSPTSDAGGMTSETFDDYEEGTWTPALTSDGTMSSANGTYTKVGRLVHVKFSFTVNQINSASTNHVTGLPYSAAEQGYGQHGYFASLGSGATNAFNSISPYATGGTIYWNIITTANAFSQNPVMLGNSARCDGTITYTTN